MFLLLPDSISYIYIFNIQHIQQYYTQICQIWYLHIHLCIYILQFKITTNLIHNIKQHNLTMLHYQNNQNSTSGLSDIQRTKKTLDQLQSRMKSYKKQRQQQNNKQKYQQRNQYQYQHQTLGSNSNINLFAHHHHNSNNSGNNNKNMDQFIQSPYPDLQMYLSKLINSNEQEDQQKDRDYCYQNQNRRMTKPINNSNSNLNNKLTNSNCKNCNNNSNKNTLNYSQSEDALLIQFNNNRKKTQKDQHKNISSSNSYKIEQITIPPSLDLHKHSQIQLQKSQLKHLDKLHTNYQQNIQLLDNKIDSLVQQKNKIKQDKLLLMRENQQLECNIDKQREKREKNGRKQNNIDGGNINGNQQQYSKQDCIVRQLNSILSRLAKKLAKIQLENSKIIQRKKNLQVNMRLCLRNGQEQIRTQLNMKKGEQQLRKTKSKSAFYPTGNSNVNNTGNIYRANKCAYH